MVVVRAQMQLVASSDISDLYEEMRIPLEKVAVLIDEAIKPANNAIFQEYNRARQAFLVAARADLGIDD
jgi:hypothetical protein